MPTNITDYYEDLRFFYRKYASSKISNYIKYKREETVLAKEAFKKFDIIIFYIL